MIQEAALVTKELVDVVFVGAVAVMLHTGRERQSHDVDFVVGRDISTDEFLDKEYKVDFYSEKLYTPRGIKIDLYKKHDFGGIPLDHIVNTAVTKQANGTSVSVISLEGLLISKHRAGRAIDISDLDSIIVTCGSEIDWNEMEYLAKSNVELTELRELVKGRIG